MSVNNRSKIPPSCIGLYVTEPNVHELDGIGANEHYHCAFVYVSTQSVSVGIFGLPQLNVILLVTKSFENVIKYGLLDGLKGPNPVGKVLSGALLLTNTSMELLEIWKDSVNA